MIIYPIVYPSALQFWFNVNYYSEKYLPKNAHFLALPKDYRLSTVQSTAETLSQMYCLDYPIRLLAPNVVSRISQKEFSCSVKSVHIPENSFVRADDLPGNIAVYVACPEYCFFKAASFLSLFELILLGYQLCAKYTIDSNSHYHQRNRAPITNVERISSFLKQCHGAHGVKKALRAISYVLDNSNSPMESIFVMPAILPFYMGGFSLRSPELNKDISLSPKGHALLGYDKCCCDLVWSKEKVVGEYDSMLSHMETKQFFHDKKRASALVMSGYKVFNITYEYMNNFTSYEKLYDSFRCALGKRSNPQKMAKYADARFSLFQFLRSQSYKQ